VNDKDELARVGRGALWGALAALVMALFMGAGLGWSRALGSQASAFPRLIGQQIVGREHGALPVLLATFGHFIYGALAGLTFAYFARPMTLAKGIGWGVFLWFVMSITWMPWLGLSDFGLRHGRGGLAIGTLVLHLVYGITLGALGAHDDSEHRAAFDDLGRLLRWARPG
jgi:hypothetical protein